MINTVHLEAFITWSVATMNPKRRLGEEEMVKGNTQLTSCDIIFPWCFIWNDKIFITFLWVCYKISMTVLIIAIVVTMWRPCSCQPRFFSCYHHIFHLSILLSWLSFRAECVWCICTARHSVLIFLTASQQQQTRVLYGKSRVSTFQSSVIAQGTNYFMLRWLRVTPV